MKFDELTSVPFKKIKVKDNFWKPKVNTIQKKTIPDLLKIAEKEGKIKNFALVAGKDKGEIALYNCPDSDVYKIMEAASNSLLWEKDQFLEEKLEEMVTLISQAQANNGYINTQYMLPFDHPASPGKNNDHVQKFGYGPEWQWQSSTEIWPKGYGQLYCAGHLMEAAVAHYNATNKENFLEVAINLADHINNQFNNKREVANYADHPEIGIGLCRLFKATENKKYLRLGRLLVNNVKFSRPPDIGHGESDLPLEKQRNAFGHCVRTMYIYSGATDIIRELGDFDFKKAIDSLWDNVINKKMYIHGGIGNGTRAEQHGYNYDLPNEEAYAESCASIGMVLWNHRLNLLEGNSKYIDILELAAYNSALSGISLDGTKYFYCNKLAAPEDHKRRRRYLFCCPSNLPRFITGIKKWMYAKDNYGIYINLFMSSKTQINLPDNSVIIKQETNYPWSEKIKMLIEPEKKGEFSINLRIPGWAIGHPVPGNLYYYSGKENVNNWFITVNGNKVDKTKLKQGYLKIEKEWQKGDKIEIHLPQPVRRVYSHPAVEGNKNRVALMRGPIVYCLEGIDQQEDITNISLPPNSEFELEHREELLDGVTVINSKGKTKDNKQIKLTAIPYYAWDNREYGTMMIWIPEKFTPEIEKEQKKFINFKEKEHNTNG